ncbi:amidase domain-containing protein [Cohnella hongkongensis]|uniref:Amidase domain-containing protein n=1 Tax=Cohnella hongkongensis TaxID=178337 RepID=A0ABV9FCG8_9BACL
MPGEDTDWKQALFEYVNTINEAFLNADSRKLRDIPDKEHRERLNERVLAAPRGDGKWAIRTVRSEMRVRIERFQGTRGEAAADVSIHLVRMMEQQDRLWSEERVERERLRFVRTAKAWRLETVRPLPGERPGELAAEELNEVHDPWDGEKKTPVPSAPFMNPNALYGFKSRVYAGAYAQGDDGWGYGAVGRGTPYLREEAVAYAERWWNEPNPAYENFEVNCTNYVSQCLFAGGAPMNYTGRRSSGWWYKGYSGKEEGWSFSWAVAAGLQHYLAAPRGFGLRAETVHEPGQLKLGDVICYDWDGSGRVGHTTIVTAFTPEGMPLVNANTVSSRHRYWDYKDSYAWTDKTRYYFYHIADEF